MVKSSAIYVEPSSDVEPEETPDWSNGASTTDGSDAVVEIGKSNGAGTSDDLDATDKSDGASTSGPPRLSTKEKLAAKREAKRLAAEQAALAEAAANAPPPTDTAEADAEHNEADGTAAGTASAEEKPNHWDPDVCGTTSLDAKKLTVKCALNAKQKTNCLVRAKHGYARGTHYWEITSPKSNKREPEFFHFIGVCVKTACLEFDPNDLKVAQKFDLPMGGAKGSKMGDFMVGCWGMFIDPYGQAIPSTPEVSTASATPGGKQLAKPADVQTNVYGVHLDMANGKMSFFLNGLLLNIVTDVPEEGCEVFPVLVVGQQQANAYTAEFNIDFDNRMRQRKGSVVSRLVGKIAGWSKQSSPTGQKGAPNRRSSLLGARFSIGRSSHSGPEQVGPKHRRGTI